MKKVLFVIPYLSDGGAERALSNLTMHLSDEYDIDILVNSSRVIDYPYKGNIITLGIDSEKKTESLWFQVKAFVKRNRKLRKLKRNNNYSACISFMDSANVSNILTSGRNDCKTIVSVRVSIKESAEKDWHYRFIVGTLIRIFYNRAYKVVSVSDELSRELVDFFGLKDNKVVTIVNGYDADEIYKQSDEPLSPEIERLIEGRKVIFTAGRLTEQKGHKYLIDAIKSVTDVIPNVLLVIAGEGELKGILEAQIKILDLNDNVKLIGQQKNVFAIEKHADLFVMPSLWEGFPNALVEAMCVGCPVIATDFKSGAREILLGESLINREIDSTQKGYGVVVPMCNGIVDVKRLSQAIIEILGSEEELKVFRTKSMCRGRKYSIENTVAQWEELI